VQPLPLGNKLGTFSAKKPTIFLQLKKTFPIFAAANLPMQTNLSAYCPIVAGNVNEITFEHLGNYLLHSPPPPQAADNQRVNR